MEDEARLQSFTRPLPGYEAGRRVSVNVTIPGGAHEYKSTLLSPPLPQLRSTTSDLTLRKPQWDNGERRGITASDLVMPVSPTNCKLSGRMVWENSHSPVNTPRSPTTHGFGVIGDGRSQASSQQQSQHLLQTQVTANRQSSSQKSAFLDNIIHPNVQSWPISQAFYTRGEVESSISSQYEDSSIVTGSVSDAISPIRRSRSDCNSNPWAPNEPDSAHTRRVSRPVVPLTLPFVSSDPEETSHEPITQWNSLPARISHPSIPPVWRRERPPLTVIRENRGQKVENLNDGLPGSRFDPDSFTLPFGVRSSLANIDAC